MKLAQLLQKVAQQQPINFKLLVDSLPTHINWNDLFSVEQTAKNRHRVSIKNHTAFEALLRQSLPPSSRSEAAAHHYASSHDIKCDSAYLLCLPATLRTANSQLSDILANVKVVMTQYNKMQPLSFKPFETAILIENQDCFFQFDRLLSHYAKQIDISHSDIYFSAGSRILNDAFSELLSQYNTRMCLFDYDLAGLDIMRTLRNKYDGETRYVLPDNILTMQQLFTFFPKETKHLSNMLDLCKQESLHDLTHVITQTKMFMEQEALLHIS